MKKFWFKPKKYGYGFYPISWQGWLATLLLVSLVAISAYINGMFDRVTPDANSLLRFGLDVTFIVFISINYFENKTDGEIKWRWGAK